MIHFELTPEEFEQLTHSLKQVRLAIASVILNNKKVIAFGNKMIELGDLMDDPEITGVGFEKMKESLPLAKEEVAKQEIELIAVTALLKKLVPDYEVSESL